MVGRTASMRSVFVMMFCPLHRPVKLFFDNPSQWCDVELLVPHTIKSVKVRAEDSRQALALRACLMVGRTVLMRAVFVKKFRQLHRPAKHYPPNCVVVRCRT